MKTSALIPHDYESSTRAFLEDVLEGLSRTERRLPCKYFYDRRGCELFEEICRLEEYYLTRTELAIMQRHAEEMAALIGREAEVIELGSGSSLKTRILLDHLQQPAAYAPVDIAREHLAATAAQLRLRYPRLEVLPLCADFADWFEPPESSAEVGRRVVYFPGSTIGNFEPDEAETLLARIAALAGEEGGFLIGLDLQKDPRILEAAYNDSRGVTAQFNLNLLARINRELGGDFQLDRFRHSAIYNAASGRIEMHLVSQTIQAVHLAGRTFRFSKGESICTEYSYKYDLPAFCRQAARAGFRHVQTWTDPRQMFAVVYFTAE
jgi:dimethylhistidine N-methyltransferase